jgi:hypothetical protein
MVCPAQQFFPSLLLLQAIASFPQQSLPCFEEHCFVPLPEQQSITACFLSLPSFLQHAISFPSQQAMAFDEALSLLCSAL